MRKPLRLIAVFCFAFVAVIGLKGSVFGAFMPVGHPLDNVYHFQDAGWTFDVEFRLFQENNAADPNFGLFQYRYQITNLPDDLGGDTGAFQSIDITHWPNTVTGAGWDAAGPGETAPIGFNTFSDHHTFVWWPWIPDGGASSWFWLTSWAAPDLFPASGEGRFTGPAGANLPAPVPEPGTMALLGMGIVGVGFLKKARRKNR